MDWHTFAHAVHSHERAFACVINLQTAISSQQRNLYARSMSSNAATEPTLNATLLTEEPDPEQLLEPLSKPEPTPLPCHIVVLNALLFGRGRLSFMVTTGVGSVALVTALALDIASPERYVLGPKPRLLLQWQ
jgi:hypothetical protein